MPKSTLACLFLQNQSVLFNARDTYDFVVRYDPTRPRKRSCFLAGQHCIDPSGVVRHLQQHSYICRVDLGIH
jgi:hypothetical protein